VLPATIFVPTWWVSLMTTPHSCECAGSNSLIESHEAPAAVQYVRDDVLVRRSRGRFLLTVKINAVIYDIFHAVPSFLGRYQSRG
jgi:hypothetical protein